MQRVSGVIGGVILGFVFALAVISLQVLSLTFLTGCGFIVGSTACFSVLGAIFAERFSVFSFVLQLFFSGDVEVSRQSILVGLSQIGFFLGFLAIFVSVFVQSQTAGLVGTLMIVPLCFLSITKRVQLE